MTTPPIYKPHNYLGVQISTYFEDDTNYVGTCSLGVWSLRVLDDKDRAEYFPLTWKSKTDYLFCCPCLFVFASVIHHARVSC